MAKYKYESADKFFFINDDPDLHKLKVPLPKEPDHKTIDGYGLAPEDQVFQRQVYPKRLLELEEQIREDLVANERNSTEKTTTRTILKHFWRILNDRQSEYRKEIAWIKLQYWRRKNGYWCFINGKPVYHTGGYYLYVNFWTMDTGQKPEYRQIDNKIWYFKKWIIGYKVNGRRLFAGTIQPKLRRAGETSMEICDDLIVSTEIQRANVAIQSFSDKAAKEQWDKKFLPGYKDWPLIFKPRWKGKENPETKMSFVNPGNEHMKNELNSHFSFATTSDKKYFDNTRITKYHGEEYGKHEEDVYDKWMTILPCLAPGDGGNIIGEACFPTTVYDIDEGGGPFFDMCRDSIWDGGDQGTKTKLVVVFVPSDERLEGYFDKYGVCNKEEANKHIVGNNNEFLNKDTQDGKKKYLERCRLYPLRYMDSFRFSGEDSGFDLVVIDEAYQRLKKSTPPEIRRGDYLIEIDRKLYTTEDFIRNKWHRENREGIIRWETNSERGRWYSSLQLEPQFTNQKEMINGMWWPKNRNFATLGGDAFEFKDKSGIGKRAKTSKLSDGGGALFLNYDPNIDGGKDIHDYETYRFIGTYRNPMDDIDVYCEDLLWCAIYNGAMCFFESNKKSLFKHFQDRGYYGYMKYEYDTIRKEWKKEPGYWVGGQNQKNASKDELAKYFQKYIKYHFHRERHYDLVKEVKDLGGMENMGKNDLFAAAVGALKGADIDYSIFEKQKENTEAKIKLGFW